MKTTIEIADPLLREARKLAAREGVTLRAVVERGLRRVVNESRRVEPFKLQRRSFRGNGLQPPFRDASWDKVRDTIYQDRGA
ncbi:MAG TPA: type II toxin-antitoxin system VapB family antitoxin [Acetobacteraceae bacterium]|nr:type II toxin-antitoxin system VapB family antitoxin [Acetobacteraceae bacterium]